MDKFRDDIQNVPESPIPPTRTLERPKIQALEYDVQVVNMVNMENDERILESNKFIGDDEFIKSKEFMTFLYNYRGKILSVLHITPKNEKESMEKLKQDIEKEIKNMTLVRG